MPTVWSVHGEAEDMVQVDCSVQCLAQVSFSEGLFFSSFPPPLFFLPLPIFPSLLLLFFSLPPSLPPPCK